MTVQPQENPAAMFAPRRLGHANIFVGDVERSFHFYNKIAGFDEVFQGNGGRSRFLSNGNTHHDLAVVQTTTETRLGNDGKPLPSDGRAAKPGINHFGWEMENEKELVEAYNRALASGVAIHRCVDHTASNGVYLFDPDGYLHEFYADTTSDWRGVFERGVGTQITGSWEPNAAPARTDSHYPVNPEIGRVAGALIAPQRITHSVLLAGQYESMVEFYRDVAGLEVVYAAPDGAFTCFAGTRAGYACSLALFRQEGGAAPRVHHYGFQLAGENDLGAAEAALEEAGVAIDRRIDNAAKHSLFVVDPDGTPCEFFVARKPDFAAAAGAEKALRPYLV